MLTIAEASLSPSIEFILSEEAVLRLIKVSQEIKTYLSCRADHQYLASVAYCLAVDAHIDFLSRVNDKEFFTPIAWDTRTNLPSHPSMAADVASEAQPCTEVKPLLKGILKSFSQWTPIFKEKLENCACGNGGVVDVSWSILLNHTMSEKDGELTVKQFLGVIPEKPEYMEKLKAHHQPNKISQADERFVIISECVNTIANNGQVAIRAVDFWASKQVNIKNLQNLFNSLVKTEKEVKHGVA